MLIISLAATSDHARLCFVSPSGRRYFARPERRGGSVFTTSVTPGSVVEAEDGAERFRAAIFADGSHVAVPDKTWKILRQLYFGGWKISDGFPSNRGSLRMEKDGAIKTIQLNASAQPSLALAVRHLAFAEARAGAVPSATN